MIGSFNDKTNFPHKLLLTETQVSRLRIAFVNGSSANIKLSKAQLSRVIQSGEILVEFLVGLPFELPKTERQELMK